MNTIVKSMMAEYRRYKAMGEAAMAQLSEEELHRPAPGGGNSVTAVAWHIAGNFQSRFSGFLTEDGEKSWRDRESEFIPRTPTRAELLAHWESGWQMLLDAVSVISDADLEAMVTIRGVNVPVLDALHRSLAHASYHVGQIVYAGKALRGNAWEYLTIPPGQSEAYNRNPTGETPDRHAERLKSKKVSPQ